MKHKTIYNDLEMMKAVAIHHAKLHNCNYNIIILNPDDKKFNEAAGSTYEYVADSYFDTYRPNVILLHKTNDLLNIHDKDSQSEDNSKQELKNDNTNDKRYTEPFEDDGAYAD